MLKQIAILAGSRDEFSDFTMRMVKDDRVRCIYVRRLKDIAGRNFADVIKLGGYYTNPIDPRITYELKQRVGRSNASTNT